MPLPQPRLSQAVIGAAWVLLLHALLLAMLLWAWPRVERFRSAHESSRIEVRLAAIGQAQPQVPAAATATEEATAKRKLRTASPIARITTPAPRTSLSFEPATAAPDPISVRAESAPAPLPAASSILNSAATKDAIKRTLENKTFAQQAREQLEPLRAKTASETLAQEMKEASIPDCIQPNENANLLFAPKLIYDALTGKCK
jgi:hypothetical protein